MKLYETNLDFINQKVSLDHLFRIQKARTHEYWIYLSYLSEKYPELSLAMSLKWSPLKSLTLGLSSSLAWLKDLTHEVSDSEKLKYKLKYWRMEEAKKQYEKAGGRYEAKNFV